MSLKFLPSQQFFLDSPSEVGQYKMQTADCRPGTKCRLGKKCRLRILTVFSVWYMIKWHLTTYQVSQNCFSRNDFHNHLHYYKSNFVTWYIHWFLHINICVVTKQMRDKQMAHQSVCVHPWILKINQVEETVLILVCIFVIKMNTYW